MCCQARSLTSVWPPHAALAACSASSATLPPYVSSGPAIDERPLNASPSTAPYSIAIAARRPAKMPPTRCADLEPASASGHCASSSADCSLRHHCAATIGDSNATRKRLPLDEAM